MLSVVSTPIGNLSDISLRAIETLRAADVIVCEDTRSTKKLLQRHEIEAKGLTAFHAHSKDAEVQRIITMLEDGKDLALVSDAGTPGISDPGFVLIQKVLERGIEVVPIPGAAAFLTGLTASGLPTNHFLYLGFLPIKKGRKTMLESFSTLPYTVVFYESKHRIQKTISQFAELFPERELVVAREMTKIYESYYRGTTVAVAEEFLAKKGEHKGEFVVMMGPDGWRSSARVDPE